MSTITRLYLTNCSSAAGGVAGVRTKSAAYAGETPVTADSTVIPVAGLSQVPDPSALTLVIHVTAMDANCSASLGLFVGPTGSLVPVLVKHVTGAISPSADLTWRIPWYDMADAQFGVATMLARFDVIGFHGTPVNGINYEAWFELS